MQIRILRINHPTVRNLILYLQTLRTSKLQEKPSALGPVFRIRISLNADLDPGFYLNADPDPDSGFWIPDPDQRSFLPKNGIFLKNFEFF